MSDEENRRPIRARSSAWAQAAAAALARSRITPNQISVASVVFAGLGAAAIPVSDQPAAFISRAVSIQLRLICNLLDGMVAVEGGKKSAVGHCAHPRRHHLGHRLPVANDAMFGAFLLALAGLVSARLLRSLETVAKLHPALPFVWAMAWWLGAGLSEIERFALSEHHAPYGLLFVAATVAGLEGLSRLWNWPRARAGAILLLVGMYVAVMLTMDRGGHPFAGLMVLALPPAVALHYLLLAAHEKSKNAPLVQLMVPKVS